MTRTCALWLTILTAWTLTGCGDPFLLLPGGPLEGSATETPETWSFTTAIDTIQLETNAAEPYSVNIWVTAVDRSLYLHAGTNRAAWVEHMEADPRVRIRVDESIYELEAARVDDQNEFDRFSDAYEQKYGRRPGNESVVEAYLFRLVPRG